MVYSVYSAPSFYRNSGYFTLYAGTGEKQAADVLKLMLDEYSEICEKGITSDELVRSKNQMKTVICLGARTLRRILPQSGARNLWVRNIFPRRRSSEGSMAVTLDDIRAILPTVCDFSKMTAVFVGRTAEYAQELEDIIRGRR